MSIDIIIPVYNSKDTINRTLFSIAIQRNVSNINVYLINDNSDYNYLNEVNFFKNYYNITELKLNKNMGPGHAREFGIKHSNSDFIIFIDSDDYLYDPYSIYNLYNEINKGYDIVVSNFIYERDNEIKVISKDFTWLHGKIFRRSFLEKNDIHFNNTRANEDNGFNRLCLFHNPFIDFLDKITYIYSENCNSITRKDNRLYKFTGLKWLTYNYNWAMKIAIKKNISIEKVFNTSINVLVAMYYYYLELYDKYDVNKILYWSIETKNIFDKYKGQYFNYEKLNEYLNNKETEYKDMKINKIITFDEFLDKIEVITND